MEPPKQAKADRALVIEIALILLLIALGIVFYWRPAGEGALAPRWWHWVLLAAIFFSVVGLGVRRRNRRRHTALHEAIRENSEVE